MATWVFERSDTGERTAPFQSNGRKHAKAKALVMLHLTADLAHLVRQLGKSGKCRSGRPNAAASSRSRDRERNRIHPERDNPHYDYSWQPRARGSSLLW